MPYSVLVIALTVLLSAPGGSQEKPRKERAVDLALQTLVAAKQLDPEAVTVRKVREVEWPDTSLGCPQPGMSYAQVVTPGFVVFLDAGGVLYSVHVGEGRAVVCERDQKGVARATKRAPAGLFEAVAAARRELASELGVAESSIEVLSLERVSWTNPSSCCVAGLEATEDAPVAGGVLRLGAGETSYVVHIAGSRFARCPPA